MGNNSSSWLKYSILKSKLQISHKLQLRTTPLKIRKMNFCLEITWQWIHPYFNYLSQTTWNQNGQENCTSASSNNCHHWWGEKFASWKNDYKILPVHHECNPKDQKNSQKLHIRTTSLKTRKIYFILEIKLTVSSSWFRQHEPSVNNLPFKGSREMAKKQDPTTVMIVGEKFAH